MLTTIAGILRLVLVSALRFKVWHLGFCMISVYTSFGQSVGLEVRNGLSNEKVPACSAADVRQSYHLEIPIKADPDYYHKVISNYGRLDEFRLRDSRRKIEFNGIEGSIELLSWIELGFSDMSDGKFSHRQIVFVINSNAQLKEQFLDE
jgi:hypothetical protein